MSHQAPAVIEHYSGQYEQIADIYRAAIEITAAQMYSAEQCVAWTRKQSDTVPWRIRCDFKRPYVATVNGKVVGFIELDTDGHIDCHYVHPDYNRRGIGGQLLDHVIAICDARELDRVFVEASHLAKGLYLKRGFKVVRSNVVRIDNVELQNWIMDRVRLESTRAE